MKKRKSLLWRATPGKGGPVSYLFGTMHVRDLRAFGWLDQASEKLSECSVFAAEYDFSETDPVVLAQALALPEGKTLRDLLSRRAWKLLEYYSRKKLGIPGEVVQLHHPMTVSTMLSTAFMAEEMRHSLDETLWNKALELNKTTTGVETFADQIDTLKRIPLEMQLKGLTWLLKNHGRQKKRVKKMMQYYVQGDIEALYRSAKKDSKGMRKILLYRRNRLMARRFSEIARDRSLFCAVGAGHLAGGKGLLRLLKNAGFKLEPVASVSKPGKQV